MIVLISQFRLVELMGWIVLIIPTLNYKLYKDRMIIMIIIISLLL